MPYALYKRAAQLEELEAKKKKAKKVKKPKKSRISTLGLITALGLGGAGIWAASKLWPNKYTAWIDPVKAKETSVKKPNRVASNPNLAADIPPPPPPSQGEVLAKETAEGVGIALPWLIGGTTAVEVMPSVLSALGTAAASAGGATLAAGGSALAGLGGFTWLAKYLTDLNPEKSRSDSKAVLSGRDPEEPDKAANPANADSTFWPGGPSIDPVL